MRIDLLDRIINADTFKIPPEEIEGFCIHFVGLSTPGELFPFVAREVMVVMKNRKVFVCSLNLKNKKWHDYTDDLKKPESPHLHNYNLSVHGM